jgi:hypothetical protein
MMILGAFINVLNAYAIVVAMLCTDSNRTSAYCPVVIFHR